VGGRRPEGKSQFGNLHLDETLILKWAFKNWEGSTYWIYLAKDMGRWRTVENAVINVLVSYNSENFLNN
jgi:hypothetical protein